MENEHLLIIFVLLSVLIPICVFTAIAVFRARPPSKDGVKFQNEFLYASREIDDANFQNSTVAYMLQVSVTFYFIFWGYNYGFSNVFYLISWGLGIVLYVKYMPLALKRINELETLPNVVSRSSRTIRIAFGAMTCIYFLGMLYTETWFASEFLSKTSSVILDDKTEQGWWFFFIVLLLTVVFYSSWGGIRKVFATDRYQLAVGYLAFGVLFVFLISKSLQSSGLVGLIFTLVVTLVYGYLTYNSVRLGRILASFLLLFTTSLMLVVAVMTLFKYGYVVTEGAELPAGPFKQVREPGGWITLLGFVALNLVWQFCDTSNYQRIRSLQLDGVSDKEAQKMIASAFWPIMITSPVTWGLGILLGIGIKASGIVATEPGLEYLALINALVENGSAGDWIAIASLLSLGVAISSIMLSTSDSSVLAFFQSLFRDVFNTDKLNGVVVGVTSIVLTIFVLFVALIDRSRPNVSIYVILAGFNAQITVLAPVVILSLYGRFSQSIVFASIIAGTIAVWWTTFAPPPLMDWNSVFGANVILVLPILAGMGVSSIVALPMLLPKFRVS